MADLQRPTTLPGRVPGGIAGSRPGIGDDRPGVNRPGIGGNRPGIGDGNNLWNSGTIGSGNWGNNNTFNNVNVGGWGLPGYRGGYGAGYGGWANRWNTGYVNPHYGGWYNGCWGGNWGWGYGGGGYVNPYCAAMPAAVVAASPYDYSQPVVVNNYITNDGEVTDSSTVEGGTATNEQTVAPSAADAVFDAALAAFKKEDYAAALAGCDTAVKQSPNDSVIHEVRALALFALGRYPEAAATLNAVLAVAPGMDWTTMSSLYGSVDAYTQQLRKLEELCRSKPDNAAGHFVLAYHYLVGGHVDLAADSLRVVVAKQPDDVVAKRLLDAIQPTSGEAKEDTDGPSASGAETTIARDDAAAAGPETDLVGRWAATSGKDSVELVITDDSRFTWKAMPAGRPPVEIAGTIETARDAIALVSEAAGTMTGGVQSKEADAFDYKLAGSPSTAQPIAFHRQKN